MSTPYSSCCAHAHSHAHAGNGQSTRLAPDYLAAVRGISSLQQLHSLPSSVPFQAASPQGCLPSSHPRSMAPTYSVAKAPLNRGV